MVRGGWCGIGVVMVTGGCGGIRVWYGYRAMLWYTCVIMVTSDDVVYVCYGYRAMLWYTCCYGYRAMLWYTCVVWLQSDAVVYVCCYGYRAMLWYMSVVMVTERCCGICVWYV